MSNPVKQAVKSVLRPLVSHPLQASLVTWMARSGVGTDQCLQRGSLPLPVHFYSPVPDIKDLKSRNAWARRSPLPGIDFREDSQVATLRRLGDSFGRECAWPATSDGDASAFHTENNSFSFGCAASVHCIIRDRKPTRFIEVGSGRSSLVISAALDMNEADAGTKAQYTVIDPYPSPLLETLPGAKPTVVSKRVELADPAIFEQLEAGDILFVDSGHVVRIGGDVNFLILDVLPRLRPGVAIHFHDIDLPYEYPEVYATNPEFRMLWTEAYLLQAFLACNSEFDVLLAMKFLMQDRAEDFRAAFPLYDRTVHQTTSGSFWIERRATPPTC